MNYGYHPTLYSGMEDMALYAMFRQESWSQLEEGSRQQLLQEAVNRAAAENGEKGSCRVEFADLAPNVAGEQGGGVIYLNREMYVNDQRAVSYGGRLITMTDPASNLEALNTVLHEDQHAYQCQLLDGTIQPKDPAQAQEYAANDFTTVPLPQPDGSVRLGSTYMQGVTPVTGRYLYYFQSTERDAHLVAEQKTLAIIGALEARYGTEPSFQAYRQEVAANGYQAVLAEAQRLFNNPAVEREINQSLMNHYYGASEPVAPQVESVVQAEMAASYAAQNRLELASEKGAAMEAAPQEAGVVGPFDIVLESREEAVRPAEAPAVPEVREEAARPAAEASVEAPSAPLSGTAPGIEDAGPSEPGPALGGASESGPSSGGAPAAGPSAGPSAGGVEDSGGVDDDGGIA